jgi:hypothetical protein
MVAKKLIILMNYVCLMNQNRLMSVVVLVWDYALYIDKSDDGVMVGHEHSILRVRDDCRF